MNASWTGPSTTIGTSCTNSNGGQVAITVPSSGTIFVQAQVWYAINHVTGTRDLGEIVIGSSPTDCVGAQYSWPIDVPAAAPTAGSYFGGFVQKPFSVTAGTHTFYLNAYMLFGQDAADVFYDANMVAVFYPS